MAEIQPTLRELMAAVSVSKSYASVIRKGRPIPLNLAAAVYQKTGWRHPVISQLSDAAVQEIADKMPWTPPAPKAEAA